MSGERGFGYPDLMGWALLLVIGVIVVGVIGGYAAHLMGTLHFLHSTGVLS